MKVVQILPKMNVGGVERGVVDLAKFFDPSQVTTIVISGGGRLVASLQEAGIPHYTLNIYRKSPFSLIFIPYIKNILKRNKVDIVHARSRVPAWLSFFASRWSKTYFVTTAHGVYRNSWTSRVMGWGKYVICPSQLVARHMREVFNVPQEKIVIISRWVDLNKFTFTAYRDRAASNCIVSIGRLSPTKGYEYLLAAMKTILRYNPIMKLQIVGTPDPTKQDYYQHLQTLVKQYRIEHAVEFVGFRQDVENVLKRAQVLVATSVQDESFGRVVVEAFASGVPVVASQVGGYQEIIEDGQDGVLVPPADSEALARAVVGILQDTHRTTKMVEKAYQKVVQKYSMKPCLEQTYQVYKKTLQVKNILVIKISSLGDVILALPSLQALRQQLPTARITLLTSKKYAPLLYGCPYIDELVTVNDKYKKAKNILKISSDLRRKSFDYILDLQNNHASHVISFLAFPLYSYGYSLRAGFFLTKALKYHRDDDPLTSQERILKLIGVSLPKKKMVFWKQKKERPPVTDDAISIGINVAASRRWQSKNWSIKNIIQFVGLVLKHYPNAELTLFGDEFSLPRAQKVEAAYPQRIVNLCGKTSLSDLPDLFQKLHVFITPDTASLHLAAAMATPTIALFGPTQPNRHVVKGDELFVIAKKGICSGCYKPTCKYSETDSCLQKISPQEVFTIVQKIVTQKSA